MQDARLAGLIAARDWAAAERHLRRAAQRRDAPAAVFYNLAKVLEAAGRGGQRLPWLRRAVAADAAHADAWFELGRALLETRDLPGAEAALARALVLQPGAGDALLLLARVRLRMGRWAEAREGFRQVGGAEAQVALYRIACELGEPVDELRADLLSDPALRPAALKALTQVARGRLPLRLPPVQRR